MVKVHYQDPAGQMRRIKTAWLKMHKAQAVDVKDQSLRSTILYTIDHSSKKSPPLSPCPSIFLHEAVPVLSGARTQTSSPISFLS
jgi:hypothetical protein